MDGSVTRTLQDGTEVRIAFAIKAEFQEDDERKEIKMRRYRVWLVSLSWARGFNILSASLLPFHPPPLSSILFPLLLICVLHREPGE